MAFDKTKLHRSFAAPRITFDYWQYATTDDNRATVDNANYFAHPHLQVGDRIDCNCADGSILLRVTAVSADHQATTKALFSTT